LQENFFDIEVLDAQDNQIQQFQGLQQGTTIPNLEPGTYTVNEIEHPSPPFNFNQLHEDAVYEEVCIEDGGFPNGGLLVTSTPEIDYQICFKYEDEQEMIAVLWH
jgi:hypothetical protein